uniref:Putative TnpA transposase n=1 Tax=Vibrio harveyi TaxID=669 RepID=S5FXK6_VIBHA|nr:putative TnpA transposase [Vibrio harveyi]AGW25584.1 putative TnpA transposase [Vibrio harveyi]
MCELDILHDSLYQFCSELHLKRLNSLTLACYALLESRTLTGEALANVKAMNKVIGLGMPIRN